jgi:hypothetical protein
VHLCLFPDPSIYMYQKLLSSHWSPMSLLHHQVYSSLTPFHI